MNTQSSGPSASQELPCFIGGRIASVTTKLAPGSFPHLTVSKQKRGLLWAGTERVSASRYGRLFVWDAGRASDMKIGVFYVVGCAVEIWLDSWSEVLEDRES